MNTVYSYKLDNLMRQAGLAAYTEEGNTAAGTCMLVLVDRRTGQPYRKLDGFLAVAALDCLVLSSDEILQYSTFQGVNQLMELLTNKVYY